MSSEHPFAARTIRWLSPFIIVAWAAVALVVTLAVPSLEQVGQEHSVQLSPTDAPALQAMVPHGQGFQRV